MRALLAFGLLAIALATLLPPPAAADPDCDRENAPTCIGHDGRQCEDHESGYCATCVPYEPRPAYCQCYTTLCLVIWSAGCGVADDAISDPDDFVAMQCYDVYHVWWEKLHNIQG